MNMTERADLGVGVALVMGFMMFIAGVFSILTFAEFVESGEISIGITGVPCVVFAVIVLIGFLAWNVPLARMILSISPPVGRRAAYFQILFPIVLASFLLATTGASFTPSFAFGFPLFFIGTLAYPYTAIVMKRWIKAAAMANLLYVQCFRCTYVFEMHKKDDWIRCPYCGQVNMNPLKEEEGEKVSEDAQDRGVVSP